MTSRDDMVFRPSLGPEQRATNAPARAKEERRLAAARGRRGPMARLVAARTARRASQRATQARLRARRRRGGSSASRAAKGVTARGAATFVLGSVVTLAVTAAAVAARLVSGRPFEGLGEDLNQLLLGDLDDKARAKMATKRQLQGNDIATRIIAREGQVTSQIRKVAQGLFERNLRREKGLSRLRSAFPVNGPIDLLILRARDLWLRVWGKQNGPQAMEKLGGALSGIGRSMKAARR